LPSGQLLTFTEENAIFFDVINLTLNFCRQSVRIQLQMCSNENANPIAKKLTRTICTFSHNLIILHKERERANNYKSLIGRPSNFVFIFSLFIIDNSQKGCLQNIFIITTFCKKNCYIFSSCLFNLIFF
jgi:hypothetical protein